MHSQNKSYIAYLSALSVLFSYAEMLLPRFLFFKLGLANIAVILALPLGIKDFVLLVIFKSVAAGFLQGTLFSPLFLLSFSQSVTSASVMYLLYRMNVLSKNKALSVYGISAAGSFVSSATQIYVCALLLGKQILFLQGFLYVFSAASGIVTAFFSRHLHIPSQAPVINEEAAAADMKKSIIKIAVLLSFTFAVMTASSLIFLACALVISLAVQLASGRRIRPFFYVILFLVVIACAVVIPSGRVLYSIGDFSITQGALISGTKKGLKLCTAAAVSQSLAGIRLFSGGYIAETVSYFNALRKCFSRQEGSVLKKLKAVLSAQDLTA